MRAMRPADLVDVSTRLPAFDRPVLLLWGAADRFFKLPLARRLAEAFPRARLVEIEGGRTFIPLDEPDRLAREISAFLVPA
jgi:pimeloyl-ACP methyl ester carboxylesterase